MVMAVDDPFVGTWNLNVGKCKINGPAPKIETIIFTAQDNGLKLAVDGIDGEGKAYHVAYAVKFDGKGYLLTGFLQVRILLPLRGSTPTPFLSYSRRRERRL
jgi:hypothetical protein